MSNWIFTGEELNKSIIVTNLNEVQANLIIDVYFEDKEPVKGLTYTVAPERVHSFRLDKPFCDQQYKIPRGKYTLVINSDLPVAAVFGS